MATKEDQHHLQLLRYSHLTISWLTENLPKITDSQGLPIVTFLVFFCCTTDMSERSSERLALVYFASFYLLFVLVISLASAITVVCWPIGLGTGNCFPTTIMLSTMPKVWRRLAANLLLSLLLMYVLDVKDDSAAGTQSWNGALFGRGLLYPDERVTVTWALLGWMVCRCGFLYVSTMCDLAFAVSTIEYAEPDGLGTVKLEGKRSRLFCYMLLFYVGYVTNGILFAQLVVLLCECFVGVERRRLGYGGLTVPIVGYLLVNAVVVCKIVAFFSIAVRSEIHEVYLRHLPEDVEAQRM